MKKLKRFVAIVISMLIIFWGISYGDEVFASSRDREILDELTQNPYINMNEEYYGQSDNLFCVEQGQALNNSNAIKYYSTMYYIKLIGKDAELYSVYGNGNNIQYNREGTMQSGVSDLKINAKLAYILAQDNGTTKSEGAVQNAIWGYFGEWFNSDELRFPGWNDGSGIINKKLNDKLLRVTTEELYFECTKGTANTAGNQLIREAEQYANALVNGSSGIINNSNNIQRTSIDDNYVQIGPFNWTYPGNLNSIYARVGTSTNNVIEDYYDAYGYKRIQSGKDFYIKVRKDNIKNGGTLKVGGTVKVKEQNIRIYFFVANENDGNHYQNLIYREKLNEGDEHEITGEFSWDFEPMEGSLQIKKVDSQNFSRNFSGIGFKIYSSENGWLQIDYNTGNVTGYTSNKNQATEWRIPNYSGYTTSAQTRVINKLPLGLYYIYETNIGNLGDIYTLDSNKYVTKQVTGTTTDQVAAIYSNPQTHTSLQIQKTDDDTGEPIAGIGFKIYSRAESKWVVYNNGNVTYSNYFPGTNGATEFVTDSTGFTAVIKNLPLGYYDIYETKLGSHDDIYKLDEITVPGATGTVSATKIKDNYKLEASEDGLVTVSHKNKQVYVKLSGHVWLDKETSKKVARNNVYAYNYTDDMDESLEGIKVKLQYKNGNTVTTEQTTNTNKYRNVLF